jgi:hypothetical protein
MFRGAIRIRARVWIDPRCKYYHESIVDLVLTSEHEKYIARVHRPQDDVFKVEVLLYALM